MNPRFEWDAGEALSNERKHGISFETAIQVFADPLVAIDQDRMEGGEYRWRAVGTARVLLIVVAHATRDEDDVEVIKIISARRATLAEGNFMGKLVSMTIDLDNPPPLTPRQEAQLAKLAAMRDEDIDLSDIPEITAFSNAIFFRDRHKHPLYRPLKRSTTVRIDADILEWLRAEGKGYQTRLNAILREAMLREAG